MNPIGIIGAGNVGEALACRLVEQGHRVKIANSRGRGSLAAFSTKTGAEAVDLDDVTSDVSVLIIAIPMARVADLPKSLFRSFRGRGVVVDAGNYYPLRDRAIATIDRGLPESEWVSQQLGMDVVKAFNNIIASRLATNGRLPGDPRRIALPVAGGDLEARTTVMGLVEAMGFTAYDAGSTADSWRQQPGQPAYCTEPTLDELPKLLQRADLKKAYRSRDKAAKILAKLPPDYPAEQLVRVSRFSIGLDRSKPGSWLAMLRLGFALMR